MKMKIQFKSVEDLFAGRLRGNQLMMSSLGVDAGTAGLLWKSPMMKAITWLDLDDNRLGDDGVGELADCEFLENLQYLNLNKNGVTDSGLKRLSQSKFLGKLKRLHLKHNPIKGEGIMALMESGTLDSLLSLQFHEGWTCKRMEGWKYKSK